MADTAVHRSVASRSALREPGPVAAALLLTRPGLLALVAVTGLAGMVLGAKGAPDAMTALLCAVALTLAAAGSVMLNSVLDHPFDLRMARLRERTRALERLGTKRTVRIAVLFIAAGAGIAFRWLTTLSSLLILVAAFCYLVPYTLRLKRNSPFGAIPGAIPGALPVLIGYAAVDSIIGADGLILFLLVLLWQPPHFWTLALRYRDEYRASGFPVLPAALGEAYAKTLILLYATALPPLSLALWYFGFCSPRYGAAALLLGMLFLAASFLLVVVRSRFSAAFQATNWYLASLLILMIGDICLR
ncbi:protoheme IX farnesyltransferase [bacterium]|nr:protoheme IX farnesyltransferase [bacterium]